MSEQITTAGEEWREISGFPGYQVSNRGRVQTRLVPGGRVGQQGSCWRAMALSRLPTGHRYVRLASGGKAHFRYVHRLVLEAFVGPCPDGLECCHGDDDPGNNDVANLRWGTHKSNMDDRDRKGRNPRGSQIGNSKLREDQVREIRLLLAARLPHRVIALRFGISRSLVSQIGLGRRWIHLDAARRAG